MRKFRARPPDQYPDYVDPFVGRKTAASSFLTADLLVVRSGENR
jgi:hypothetical protein